MTFLHKLAKRLALIPGTLFACLGVLASCGDGTTHDYLGPDPSSPSTFIGLSIAPHDPQLIQGDSVHLEARGWLQSGLSMPATVTWSASGGSVSSDGWYRATSVGSYRVRAVSSSSGSLRDSVLVTVAPPGGIARLDVTPSGAVLAAGTRQQFTAVALMGDGSRMFPTVTWSATGGTISSTGMFTAGGTPDGYTVTAMLGDGAVLGRSSGQVDPPLLTQLTLSPAAVMLESGDTLRFTPVATWSNGSATLPPLSWTATGGSISSQGVYTAGDIPGTFRVVVSTAQGILDTADVRILPSILSIRVTPVSAVLAIGATQALHAYALRSDGTEAPIAVQWSAQGGSITASGTFTADAAGQPTVIGSLQLSALSALRTRATKTADTARFQVGPVAATITQIFVSPGQTSLQAGASAQFSVTAAWSDGTSATPAVQWSATGGSIDAGGQYTAGSVAGIYRVIAKEKNGSKADTASVTVTAIPVPTVAGFTVTPSADILAAGQTRQFSATLSWSDGQTHPANISWVSAGGTITQNGLYTAGTVAGTFLVIATCSCGAADTASVTIPVTAAPVATLTSVVMTPATVTLAPGESQLFLVSGVWSDGATSPPPVTYQATGGSISPSGMYIAANIPGTYQVIATQGGGSLADTSVVTIASALPAATLTQLILNPSSVTVPQGATQPFVVSASWSDGSSTVPPVTFSATGGSVTADGVYTAGATAGTFRIIVSQTGGTKADTSVITVPASVTLQQLVLNPSSVTVAPGGTQQFVANGLWSDGSSTAPVVSWSATGGSVSAGGLYTAGSTSGTFRVIAVQTGGTKADTSVVSISGTTSPPPSSGGTAALAELPRVYLNTAYTAPTGQIINVAAGGNLQTALNNAQPGDQIVLASGATYIGNFELPTKAGCFTNGWIVVRGAQVPPEGVRVNPTVAATYPKLVTNTVSPAILAKNGSCGWRIIGVEITATAQSSSVNYNYGLVRFGEGETSLGALPHHLILDRVYIHGAANLSTQRGVALNSASTAVIDSDIRDIYWPGTQTQAVAGWAGSGPFKIVNNYLQAAGENLMFGGADPIITNLSPSDIEVRRNYLHKPLEWKNTGKNPICNLLELKHAKRVLIEGNVLQNSWSECQSGMAFNLQSLSDANNSWTQTADVTIRYNLVQSVNQCAVFLAHGWNGSGIAMARVTFEQNFCDGVGGDQNNQAFLLAGDLRDLRITRNTVRHKVTNSGGPFYTNFSGGINLAVLDNIIYPSGLYGPVAGDVGMGTVALTAEFGTTWVFAGNVMQQTAQWANPPANNTYLTSLVMNADGSVPAFPGKGADIPALTAAIAGVIQ